MSRSIYQIIDEQIKRWELSKTNPPEEIQGCTVITISRECASQGKEVARLLAEKTGFDLFDHEILEAMVETSKNKKTLLATLDEKRMNIVDDIVSTVVNEHHLWPDEYSKLLLRIMNTIGKHGNAVILGRGGNFALKKINAMKVRLVAPPAIRKERLRNELDMNDDDAHRFMASTDANRTAFVRRYYNADVADPANYDLVLNTGTLSAEKIVEVIRCAIS